MTLLDAKPAKPPRPVGRYILLGLLVALIASLATYYFWDYPEERAVKRFLETVERGDYPTAYRLWQPSPSYSYSDFLKGWGMNGDYGKISNFEILDASSKGSETVVITVSINHQTPPLQLLVDRETKGLAYSPF
jgi:hypothetical protein